MPTLYIIFLTKNNLLNLTEIEPKPHCGHHFTELLWAGICCWKLDLSLTLLSQLNSSTSLYKMCQWKVVKTSCSAEMSFINNMITFVSGDSAKVCLVEAFCFHLNYDKKATLSICNSRITSRTIQHVPELDKPADLLKCLYVFLYLSHTQSSYIVKTQRNKFNWHE